MKNEVSDSIDDFVFYDLSLNLIIYIIFALHCIYENLRVLCFLPVLVLSFETYCMR